MKEYTSRVISWFKSDPGTWITTVTVIVALVGGVMFAVWEKKNEPPRQPRILRIGPDLTNQTLSHKLGEATKESGKEFFKGLFGMKSKREKEKEENAPNKESK